MKYIYVYEKTYSAIRAKYPKAFGICIQTEGRFKGKYRATVKVEVKRDV